MSFFAFLGEHWRLFAIPAGALAMFAVGRYTAQQPEIHESNSIAITQTVWQRTVYQRSTDVRVVRVRDSVRAPDGTVREHTEEREDSHVEEHADTSSGGRSEGVRVVERVVTPALPQWRVSALVGAQLQLNPLGVSPAVGVSVERRIAGPFFVGAWGLYPGLAGVSIGAEF